MKTVKKVFFSLIFISILAFTFSFSAKAKELTDQEKVDLEINNINVPSSVISDFPLVSDSAFGSTIKWVSSDETIIKVEITGGWAKVTRPETDTYVTLTITLSKNEVSKSKQFLVLVTHGETLTNEYKISYNLNGGTNGNNPSKYKVGSEVTLINATKEEHYFNGWYFNSDFSGEKVEKLPKGLSGDIQLFAKFTPKTVTGIELVKENGAKSVYNAKETFETNAISVYKVFDDSTKALLDKSNVTWDKTILHANDTYVTCTYQTFTAKYEVTVNKLDYNLSGLEFLDKTFVYDGLVHSYSYTGNTPQTLNIEVSGEGKDCGTYPVVFKFINTDNDYNTPIDITKTLTITKAILVVTVDNFEVKVGHDLPSFTSKITGFVANEDISVLSGEIAYSCEATNHSKAGLYSVSASGLSSKNYEIKYEFGLLTIVNGDLSIKVNDDDKLCEFDSTNKLFKAMLYQDNQVIEGITFTYKLGEEEVTSIINAGTYTVTIVMNDPTYGVILKDVELVIVEKTLTKEMFTALNDEQYTGEEIKPAIAGNAFAKALVLGQDFTVEYLNNIEKGAAKAVIKGINNFTGTVELEFVIYSPADQDQEKAQKDIDALHLEEYVNDDFTLTVLGANGSTISWVSSKNDVIAINGNTAKVTRPIFNSIIVTLTATAKNGSATLTKDFEVLVEDRELTDTEKVEYDKDNLKNNLSNNFSTSENFTLPTSKYGSTITWESNNNAIKIEGNQAIVKRELNDVKVSLTATITSGEISDKIIFDVTVTKREMNDEEKVNADLDELTISGVIEDSILLPTTGSKGSTITWVSSDNNIITIDGTNVTVTRPIGTDKTVTLTATVKLNAVEKTKTFNVTVKNISVEYGIVGFKGNEIDSGQDVNYNADLFTQGSNLITNFKGVYKVYKGIYGLKFSSSSENGKITFVFDNYVSKVILTTYKFNNDEATITVNGKEAINGVYTFDKPTKEVSITAIKRIYLLYIEINTDTTKVQQTKLQTPTITIEGNVVNWQAIEGADGYDVFNGETKLNSSLITTTSYALDSLTELGKYNITIKAIVNKPLMISSDLSNVVVYEIKGMSDDEKVALDKEALTIDSPQNANFVLPSTGANGSVITWISNNEAIKIEGNNAIVTRALDANVTVTLTATLTLNSTTENKEIEVVVEKELIKYGIVKFNEGSTDGYSTPAFDTLFAQNDSIISGMSNASTIYNGTKGLKLSSSKKSGTVTFTFVDLVSKVILTTNKYQNEVAKITVNNIDVIDGVYTLEKPTKEITISADKRVYLLFIEVNTDTSKIEKTKLASPVITLNNETKLLSWEAIENARGYDIYDGEIKVNNVLVNNTSYDLSSIVSAGTHIITVKAIAQDALLTDSDASNQVSFEIIEITDEEKVALDKEALTLELTQSNNFVLPKEGLNGSTITWVSDKDVITINGNNALVNQSTTANETVKLTATLTLNSASITKEFTITVPKLETKTISEFLELSDGPTFYVLTGVVGEIDGPGYGNFTLIDQNNSNITIYVYGVRTSKDAKSSNTQWELLNVNKGDIITICGPKNTFNNKPQVGGNSYGDTKLYAYYISHTTKELTDEEKVELDKNEITIDAEVDKDFSLVSGGTNGSVITWESNNSAITINGLVAKVTRSLTEDINVRLTATLTLNSASTQVVYDVVVKMIPNVEELTYGKIVFSISAKEGTEIKDKDSLNNNIVDGNDLINEVTNISKVYTGTNGLKFGSSSAVGVLTIKLNKNYNKVILGTIKYGSENSAVTVNGTSAINGVYTFETPTNVITISASSKRFYLLSIELNTDSSDITKEKLDSPVISINENVVSWGAITNANGYDVYVNGEKDTTVTGLTYTFNSQTAGIYTITVKAVGNDVTNTTSDFSNAVSYTQKVITDDDLIEEDKAEITLLDEYLADFTLKVKGKNNSTITWNSNNNAIIIDGNKAKVTRPQSNEGDALVTLVATFTLNSSNSTKTFEVVVKAQKESSTTTGTIEFKTNTSDATTELKVGNINDQIVSGSDYITSISDIVKVYSGKEGLKFSSSSNKGSLTIVLNRNVNEITLVTSKYGTDNATIIVNGKEAVNGVYILDTLTNTITITATKESKQRFYLASITFKSNPLIEEKTKVDSPIISLNGTNVSWAEIENATGYDVYDGNTKLTESPITTTLYSLENISVAGDHIITVIALSSKDGYTNSDVSNQVTYTIAAGEANWTKVINDTQLKIGQKYVITNNNATKVAGSKNGKYLESKDFRNDLDSAGEGALIFTLGGSAGAYLLNSKDGYLASKGSDIDLYETVGDTCKWNIVINNGNAVISYNSNSLQYNSSSPRFKTYTTNQTPICLYTIEGDIDELTDQQKLNYDIQELQLPAAVSDSYDLVTSGKHGSTITWTIDNSHLSNLSNNKLVNESNTDVTVTLNAKLKINACEHTSTFTITIRKKSVIVDADGYYEDALNKQSNQLLLSLRSIITDTHHKKTTYDDLKDYLPESDEDPNNKNNMILFYSRASIKKVYSCTTWNREHVWCQSLSWFTTSQAGSDLHHLRPTDPTVNSTRNNNRYGLVTSGKNVMYGSILAGKVGGGYFEPKDEVKGDCARIIFYLKTRYSEADSRDWAVIASSYALLLQWHNDDPVDQLEINRNNYIFSIQGNRNPFIDNPTFAQMIWGTNGVC